jgi:hypothetical protein
MFHGWINSAFIALPGTKDALFKNLWTEKRLLFEGQRGIGDVVDDCSARLVAAALREKSVILVVLPDFQPHRPAFLFATGLIRHWYDSRSPQGEHGSRTGPILYFGSAVGIRDQLRCTTVSNLRMNLSDVFSQKDIKRGATSGSSGAKLDANVKHDLPKVVTVYSPADPVGVIRSYNPSWIAVDCGDVPKLIWLKTLMDEAARREIPLIAWGQNPFSECVDEFDDQKKAFIWPPSIQLMSHEPAITYDDPEDFLTAADSTSLLPIVVAGERVNAFSALLLDVGHILGRASQSLQGQFSRDAIAVHWRYLRSLESLSIPIDFYEAEAPRLWGLNSFERIGSACNQFRSACEQTDPHLYNDLERVGDLLHEAKSNLENRGCSLWDALSNLCVEDPPSGEARIILFTSNARKKLFLFALLARHNFAESDLEELRTMVLSLNEYRRCVYNRNIPRGRENTDELLKLPDHLTWHPILVGLPSPAVTPRLLPVFLQKKLDILLYPHQCPLFMRRQAEWLDRLSANGQRVIGNIVRLGGGQGPEAANFPFRLTVTEAIEMNAETASKAKIMRASFLWKPDDIISEVSRIFQTGEDTEEDGLVPTDQVEGATLLECIRSEEIWCPEAIRVRFEHGWFVHFAPDDIINVINNGSLDQRYVRSLAGGDRVLLIHGQERQSLYDLVISRVHKHPSIELHLAMIRRWQDDFRIAFHQWKKATEDDAEYRECGARDIDGLLRRLRKKGSHLICATTLSFWLNGFVLCPLDPEDLYRLAEVLDISFVRQYHRRIVQAANRLRGLHRSLSLRLNRWMEDHAAGSIHRSDEEVIDAELGLTFGDIRNSLLVLRVIEIQNVNGLFLRSELGRTQREV